MNKYQEALGMYNLAQEIAKDNPLIRFRKAHLLTIMQRYKVKYKFFKLILLLYIIYYI